MADRIKELVRRTAERQSVLPDPNRAKRVFPPPLPSPVPDTGYSQALAGMVDKEFIKSTKYGDQQFRADIIGAHPVIVEFSTLLVRRMRALGVPLFPHCVWRGREEQEKLFAEGFTKAHYPDSAHNRGCAVDIVHSTKAWELTERQWQIIGHVGYEIAAANGYKLVWGGDDVAIGRVYRDDFNWDPAHWELEAWRSHARVKPQPTTRAVR